MHERACVTLSICLCHVSVCVRVSVSVSVSVDIHASVSLGGRVSERLRTPPQPTCTSKRVAPNTVGFPGEVFSTLVDWQAAGNTCEQLPPANRAHFWQRAAHRPRPRGRVGGRRKEAAPQDPRGCDCAAPHSKCRCLRFEPPPAPSDRVSNAPKAPLPMHPRSSHRRTRSAHSTFNAREHQRAARGAASHRGEGENELLAQPENFSNPGLQCLGREYYQPVRHPEQPRAQPHHHASTQVHRSATDEAPCRAV